MRNLYIFYLFVACAFSDQLVVIHFQAHAPYPYCDPIFSGPLVAYAPQATVSVSDTSMLRRTSTYDLTLTHYI